MRWGARHFDESVRTGAAFWSLRSGLDQHDVAMNSTADRYLSRRFAERVPGIDLDVAYAGLRPSPRAATACRSSARALTAR